MTLLQKAIAWIRRHISAVCTAGLSLGLTIMASPAFAGDSDLDTAINDGFGKLVKYARWGSVLLLGGYFLWSWAQRSQSAENPHDQNRSTKQMVYSALGFIAVIGYKLVLSGIVKWFNIDPTSIPQFLWQA